MKKIITFLLITSLLFTPVYAEEMFVQSTLTYTCDDSYFINIPETIYVGEESYVEAMEINIAPGKTVKVDIGDPRGYVQIYSVNDNSKSLDIGFRDEAGTETSVTNTTIARFESGESGTKVFSTYANLVDGMVAGEYMGTVTFNIHCE